MTRRDWLAAIIVVAVLGFNSGTAQNADSNKGTTAAKKADTNKATATTPTKKADTNKATATTPTKKADANKGTTTAATKQAGTKDKKDNSETYTVHKSGDAGGGPPTYSTGGLNPNPSGSKNTKKDESTKKGDSKKKDEK